MLFTYSDFTPSYKLQDILKKYIGDEYISKVQKINVDEVKEGNFICFILSRYIISLLS